jgi:hypothetical protein
VKLKNVILAAAVAGLLAAFAIGCASNHYVKYTWQNGALASAEYSETSAFTQGWSNGAGKTVDVHPELSVIGK